MGQSSSMIARNDETGPRRVGFDEARLVMGNLATLRPEVVQGLLEACCSVKVKRLFLYMAENQEQEDATDHTAAPEIHEAGDSGRTEEKPHDDKTGLEGTPQAAASVSVAASAAAPVTLPPVGDISFPRPLADILQDKTLLSVLHTRLADIKDLRDLIADPPVIFMDEGQQLFFYRGCPIKLQPASFQYLLILAAKPKQIIARDEIYRRLWPGNMNYDGSNKPYERQISDHKRRCIAQIKKGIAGKIAVEIGELETLIFTRPKVGYMLNVRKEDVLIIMPH